MSTSALAITDDHRDLADSASGQLRRIDSRAAARATLDGGSGFGLAELAVVLEAQGRELCPGPFLSSVAAAVVIDRCAAEDVRAQFLAMDEIFSEC